MIQGEIWGRLPIGRARRRRWPGWVRAVPSTPIVARRARAPASLSHPPVIVIPMENDTTQLTLLETGSAVWRLDERTRETGRKGVAEARRALAVVDRRPAA